MTALPVPRTLTLQPPTLTPIADSGTPTPDHSQLGTPLGLPVPTATPLLVSKTTDLAPGMVSKDKISVYVQHSSGLIELFLIARGTDISTTIPLQTDDVILFASLKTTPPLLTTPPLPFSTAPAATPCVSPSPTSTVTLPMPQN